MAISISQHVLTNGGGAPIASPLGITVTSTSAGNLLVAYCLATSPAVITGVTDNATGGSNTYVLVLSQSPGLQIYCCLKAAHAGATTVSLAWTGGSAFAEIGFFEVSGFTNASVDTPGMSTGVSAGDGTITGPAVTINSSKQEFIGAYCTIGSGTITQNPKTGNEFTSGGNTSSFGSGLVSLLTSVNGVHTPVWLDNTAADSFSALIAAFRELGSDAPIFPENMTPGSDIIVEIG